METTWGIYAEISADRHELWKSGGYPHALSDPNVLLGTLWNDIYDSLVVCNTAYSFRIVAWAGGGRIIPFILGADERGDTYVEITLRDKSSVVPRIDDLTTVYRYGRRMNERELVELWREANQKLRDISELLPEDYDFPGDGDAIVVMIHKILHGVRDQDELWRAQRRAAQERPSW